MILRQIVRCKNLSPFLAIVEKNEIKIIFISDFIQSGRAFHSSLGVLHFLGIELLFYTNF